MPYLLYHSCQPLHLRPRLLPLPALDGGRVFFLLLNGVLYALFRSYVKDRLAKKAVPAEKWRDPPPAPPRRR